MKAKTVAERAAELGTDKRELVRALKALSVYKIVSGPRKRVTSTWRAYWYRPMVQVMSLEQAAELIGVDFADAQKEIKASYPVPWNEKRILDGIFAFIKREGRWPMDKDLRNKNGLPSPAYYRWYAGRNNWDVSARDWWERTVARDKRCTAEMALTLRNVLARKEALDRIGLDKLIKTGFAVKIDEHPEFGTLYRMPGETPQEPTVMLKVINSTPEPDGSFSNYFLRVPPEMTDVREAVKWTFNDREAIEQIDYAPLIET